MKEFPAELMGGPFDGQVWALKEDLPSLRFAVMLGDNGPVWGEEATEHPELPLTSNVGVVEYLRTRIVNDRGNRWYTYYNPKR